MRPFCSTVGPFIRTSLGGLWSYESAAWTEKLATPSKASDTAYASMADTQSGLGVLGGTLLACRCDRHRFL